MTDILIIRRENTETQPWKDEGRDWSDVSTNQGRLRIAGNHQKLGKRQAWQRFPLPDSRRNQSLMLDFHPPELWENTFLSFCNQAGLYGAFLGGGGGTGPSPISSALAPIWSTQKTVFDAYFLSCFTDVNPPQMEDVNYLMTVST